MDNRIANDMISSGMIPSGEKNKEDLGRTQYGSVPSPSKLMDAYKSMYDKKEEVINEHHQKDKDGNTIPHEGEELKEGKIPAGLQAYLDKKKGKKEDKKDMKEEVDKFDIVFNHFISEGYSEKEAYAEMSNLTEEQLDEILGALATAGMKAATTIGAKAKPIATAMAKQGKALGKVDAIAKVKPKVSPGQMSLDLKGKGGMSPDTPSSVATGRMSPRRADTESGNLVGDEIKRQAVASAMSGGGKGQKERANKVSAGSYQAASADLFDIVKGQLLDEGLSEEEIKDIMLTLTPNEIMEELSDVVKRNDALNRERAIKAAQERKVPDKVREASKRQMKAGTPREDKNNPYTTQDKKTIINYNKDKGSM